MIRKMEDIKTRATNLTKEYAVDLQEDLSCELEHFVSFYCNHKIVTLVKIIVKKLLVR